MKNPKVPTLAVVLAVVLATVPSVVFPAAAAGQTVSEGWKLRSKIIGREVAFAVYLPPDYATSGRRYPVVYLLHG